MISSIVWGAIGLASFNFAFMVGPTLVLTIINMIDIWENHQINIYGNLSCTLIEQNITEDRSGGRNDYVIRSYVSYMMSEETTSGRITQGTRFGYIDEGPYDEYDDALTAMMENNRMIGSSYDCDAYPYKPIKWGHTSVPFGDTVGMFAAVFVFIMMFSVKSYFAYLSMVASFNKGVKEGKREEAMRAQPNVGVPWRSSDPDSDTMTVTSDSTSNSPTASDDGSDTSD